jgi:AraC-like DNA-binding protein
LVLEFCRKGQISWAGGALPCNQLNAGEMLVYDAWTSGALTRSTDYCGDRILFYEESAKYIQEHFAGFALDIRTLAQKMCRPGRPFIVHTKEEVARAFEKIENKSEKTQAEYCRLAILELLLTLKNLDTQREYACRECNLSSMQIEKIYCIRSFICENMDSHFTIEELSDKFDMPPTAMKLCFKNVFGLPVFTYARRERMKLAAKQLRECDRGILEIAGEVGYNNGSKFAHAFQDVMGMTPKEYRKKYRMTNVA